MLSSVAFQYWTLVRAKLINLDEMSTFQRASQFFSFGRVRGKGRLVAKDRDVVEADDTLDADMEEAL